MGRAALFLLPPARKAPDSQPEASTETLADEIAVWRNAVLDWEVCLHDAIDAVRRNEPGAVATLMRARRELSRATRKLHESIGHASAPTPGDV
jgi:hypothetical protein